MSARPIDLIAAARQRLAVQRHWRAVARAGGDRSASVNRAEYRADQARQCLAALALAAQERIEPPAPQCGKAQADIEIEAREVTV